MRYKIVLFFIFSFSTLLAQLSGEFDVSFNQGNTLYTYYNAVTGKKIFSDMAVQPDNKILVCAESRALNSSGDSYYLVYRINEDGTPDNSFGEESFAAIEGGVAYSMALQDDGKILVIGVMNTINTLVRLNADGSLDDSFGNAGKVEVPMSSFSYQGTIYNMKILSSGKILLAGRMFDGANYKVLLIQLNEDGTVDTEFGSNGYIEKMFENSIESAHFILEQTDGKIVILGYSQYGSVPKLFASRINTDGSFDESFGTSGYAVTELRRYQYEESDKIKGRLQAEGKIVVAGYGDDPNDASKENFAAVRINNDGSIDDSFGENGYINIDFNETGNHDYAYDLLIALDGNIILGGSYTDQNNFTNLGILVLDQNGAVVSDFGNNGRATGLGNSIRRMYFDSEGRIVAGGLTSQDSGMLLARFIYDGNSTSVNEETNNIPDQFSLSQNYPNPFNPTTSIDYSVPSSEYVTLKIFDILGNEIVALVDEQQSSGSYEVSFNASELTSGVYFYKLSVGNKILTKKMMLLK